MTFVMALDQGTTSSRAILFDRQGHIASVAQEEFTQHFPRPDRVEHDAREIWATQSRVARQALDQLGARPGEVAAVGITNQRETTVVWDRATGEPVCHAIVWQDRRTAARCKQLVEQGHGELVRRKTGLVLDAYFSGTKLAWILDHVEGARARAAAGELAFGTVDTWLAWCLTRGACHVTDPSNASRTLLYDIHADAWDDELLELLDIPPSLLPEVRPSVGQVGTVTPDLLGAEVPLAGILGDQQAALLGQGCTRPGLAKNTYGTGCFLLMNTGERARDSHHRLLSTVAWQRDGATTYALEGSVFVGGALVQWLRDGLGLIDSAAQIESLAASVPHSDGVVLVPALTGLGAPHWDPFARGALLGITRGTTRAHVARAALEGIAFQVADLVTAMEADADTTLSELRVDGGAAANDLLLQVQADLLGVPVVRPRQLESTALGAATAAGLAVGLWSSVDDIEAHHEIDRRFEPGAEAADVAARKERWAEAVSRCRGWSRGEE